MQEELCNIAFPMCICRLTLAWISSEISTKLLGMPTHLDQSSFTAAGLSHADWSLLLSGVDWLLASPFANCLLRVPLSNSYSSSPAYFRSRRDLESKPFAWFRAKTDKGIVCLADHLHSVTKIWPNKRFLLGIVMIFAKWQSYHHHFIMNFGFKMKIL